MPIALSHLRASFPPGARTIAGAGVLAKVESSPDTVHSDVYTASRAGADHHACEKALTSLTSFF